MTKRAQTLLREALALPVHERADVAAELLASLDDPPAEDLEAVQAAWVEGIEWRARRVLAGESTGEPWDDVRERQPRTLGHDGGQVMIRTPDDGPVPVQRELDNRRIS